MRILLAVATIIVAGAAQAAESLSCSADEGRSARALGGEIAGQHEYREDLGNGWTFVLASAPHGWDIRVFDAAGGDLTQLTPPFRFEANTREIYGWHFRNADNTATNDGSVNAPQTLRAFTISPGVSRAGGLQVSTAGPALSADEGRGVLVIRDYGLADLAQGTQARMVYLRFEACLSWPSSWDAPAPVTIPAEDYERFSACGLASPLALVPYLSPYMFEGDFDGDGAFDIAGTIARESDGKRGIAVCRAGAWLDILGLEGEIGELTPEYFDRMDYWYFTRRGPVAVSPFAEGPAPMPPGDTFTLGREGASSVLVYWDGAQFQSYWQGD